MVYISPWGNPSSQLSPLLRGDGGGKAPARMSPCRTVRGVFSKKTREVGFGKIGSLRDSTTCRPVSALSTVLGWSQVAGGGWLEAGGWRQVNGWSDGTVAGGGDGWSQVAGGREQAGGCRQLAVAGGWEGEVAGGWLQVGGGWLEDGRLESRLVAGGRWLDAAEEGGSWLEKSGRREVAGGWLQVAGGWLEDGSRLVAGGSGWRRDGWRKVAGGWEGEVAGGCLQVGRGVAGWLEWCWVAVWLVWWGFGIAYRYRTEPKLRNTGNTYTAKYRIRIGIDRTARLQP